MEIDQWKSGARAKKWAHKNGGAGVGREGIQSRFLNNRRVSPVNSFAIL